MRLDFLRKELEKPDVWSDGKRAQELGKEKKQLETVVERLDSTAAALGDSMALFELAEAERDDGALESIGKDVTALETTVADMEFKRMFSNAMDSNNCFVDIQSGTGGTEAQDWAAMLERMYLRYCERKGFRV